MQHVEQQVFCHGPGKCCNGQFFRSSRGNIESVSGGGFSLGDPGENVFVISLARRPEKRERVLQQLEEQKLHLGRRWCKAPSTFCGFVLPCNVRNATLVNAMDGDGILYQKDVEAIG